MATEVEFHTGVADVPAFACRLLRKAYRRGAQLLVTADEPDLSTLDRLLWTQDALDFLPHVRWPAPEPLATRSPIWLSACLPQAAQASGRVFINLGLAVPPAPAGLARIIEVVGQAPDQVRAGRARWREYQALGLGIVHHAVS